MPTEGTCISEGMLVQDRASHLSEILYLHFLRYLFLSFFSFLFLGGGGGGAINESKDFDKMQLHK